ncbi:pre-16S rRNA-processing nuclease YqgF [Euhalothece natronophila Z-M001]|uniref:Pre-16S rRNA-processing nuclease YqgF n=1 Tax=Euhalothece natronophila Z-M001 TaxID=522448 RepID=A0A5B8NQE7_9CHRO|nr:pre-16S rRNA-processing nuclease YqgF [Euhalothece natronophila]QDZ40469.1 pre-16S rRNA-processing nuclease YqgF [Euhalothece natronophila Z-M001]
MVLLGFDPGRDKCGLALVGSGGNIILREVVTSEKAVLTIKEWSQAHSVKKMVMGDKTTSKQWRDYLQKELPNLSIVMVDESHSTLEARQRYWELSPPKGLMRFLPKGLRVPPCPVDDIVAVILVERYQNS